MELLLDARLLESDELLLQPRGAASFSAIVASSRCTSTMRLRLR